MSPFSITLRMYTGGFSKKGAEQRNLQASVVMTLRTFAREQRPGRSLAAGLEERLGAKAGSGFAHVLEFPFVKEEISR